MRANPVVPWGGSVQRSGGETSEPSQVYLGGISPPGPNAGLRSLKALTDTPDPYDDVSRFSRLERAGAAFPRALAQRAGVCVLLSIYDPVSPAARSRPPRRTHTIPSTPRRSRSIVRLVPAAASQRIAVAQVAAVGPVPQHRRNAWRTPDSPSPGCK